MLRPLVKALCAAFDALKNLEQRVLCLEEGVEGVERYPRQDVVWEKLDHAGLEMRRLYHLPTPPLHGQTCNCVDCKEGRGGEVL